MVFKRFAHVLTGQKSIFDYAKSGAPRTAITDQTYAVVYEARTIM